MTTHMHFGRLVLSFVNSFRELNCISFKLSRHLFNVEMKRPSVSPHTKFVTMLYQKIMESNTYSEFIT